MVARSATLYYIYALMLFCFTSVTASRVTLSLYALKLGLQPDAVGLLFASIYVIPLVLSWPIGMVCDRQGSRGLLLASTITSACGMAIPFLAPGVPALFLAAVMCGIAFAVYNVALQNMIGVLSGSAQERARNFSDVGVVGASTSFFGPLYAGLTIDHAGHEVASLLVGAISLPATLLLVIWGKHLPGAAPRAARGSNLRTILGDRRIRWVIVLSALVQIGQDIYMFFMPIYGHGIGLSASAIGSLLAVVAVAEITIRFFLPRLIAWLGGERLLALAFAIAAGCYALVPMFELVVALGVICFMFGLVTGCGQPLTTILLFNHCAPGRSGETFGVRQTIGNLMRVGGPAAFGALALLTGLAPVYAISALLMGAASWFTYVRSRGEGRTA